MKLEEDDRWKKRTKREEDEHGKPGKPEKQKNFLFRPDLKIDEK